MSAPDESGGNWTLLTGHGHVLVEIARDPGARVRDIAAAAGITERTVQAIVADLEAAGYITRTRTGRRTRYTVNPDSLFRHSAQGGHRVGPFLNLLAASGDRRPRAGHEDGDRRPRAGHEDGEDRLRAGLEDQAQSG
jgi:MarR family